MIPLISSGFTDKLCKAPDVYQRIRTTRVGGTEERGRKRKKDGGKVSWGGRRRVGVDMNKMDGWESRGGGGREGGGSEVGLKLSEMTPSK